VRGQAYRTDSAPVAPGIGQQATEYWQRLAADSSMLLATGKKFIEPLKKVIVLEENYTGQFAQHLRANVEFNGTEVVRVNQCSGLPFTPDEVKAALAQHA